MSTMAQHAPEATVRPDPDLRDISTTQLATT